MAEEKKARELLEEAKKKHKGTGKGFAGFFGVGIDYDEVASLYQKAGSYFKISQLWADAGNSYKLAAEISEKNLKDKIASSQNYIEAGNNFRKVNPKEAVVLLQKGIDIYVDMGRISIAARHVATTAEIYEKDIVDTQKAIECYQKAANYYRGEESKSSANRCLAKVAELSALKEDYKRAMTIYEEIALQCLDNAILKLSAKDYMFKACVVALCYDVLEAQTMFKRFCDQNRSYKDSREGALIEGIIRSVEDGDLKIFDEAIEKFEGAVKFDEWTTSLILRVKKPLEGFLDIT